MNKKAFTLIELLVVLAMMALLLAMLIPSLQQSRGLAKRVMCLSNLRQLVVAAQVYAGKYDDYYPLARETINSSSGNLENCWDFMDSKLGKGKPGLLWEGAGIAKIQQCPDFKGAANWAGDPYTGYNYNASYLGGSYAKYDNSSSFSLRVSAARKPPPPAARTEILVLSSKTARVKCPGRTAIFGDGQYTEGANKFMRSPFGGGIDTGEIGGGRDAGTQGFRHLGATNVGWCDGSASYQRHCYSRMEDPEKSIALDAYNLKHPDQRIGFLSPDNSAYDLE
jgi:prepilin-type N-terminal cleavage/methylation domain-containing protein/prepilin-type processing-associated H-X9-DG protein